MNRHPARTLPKGARAAIVLTRKPELKWGARPCRVETSDDRRGKSIRRTEKLASIFYPRPPKSRLRGRNPATPDAGVVPNFGFRG